MKNHKNGLLCFEKPYLNKNYPLINYFVSDFKKHNLEHGAVIESLTTEICQHVVAGSSPVNVEVEELFKYAISRADEEKLKAYAFDPPPPRNGRQKLCLGFYTIFLRP